MTFLRRILPSLSCLLLLCHVAGAQPPSGTPVSLNINAQPLADALAEFAQQTGLQMIVSSEVAKNLMAPQLSGAFTPEAALKQLLANSDLQYHFINPRTVTIRVANSNGGQKSSSRDTTPYSAEGGDSAQSQMRMARVDEARTEAAQDRRTSAEAQTGNAAGADSQEVLVTGSRIRTLIGEQNVRSVLTVTSKDIERYGISNFGELFRYIPQVSSYTPGQVVQQSFIFGPAPAFSRSSRITATLRGSASDGTLLLINGRRAPKNGQQSISGYDLSGIPLAAVERVEILLDGGSAIYGADAEGGVINIILKDRFQDTTVRFGAENTFDTDVGVFSGSIAHGFSLEKLSGTFTASLEDANTMMWRDRSFLASLDRRPFGGSDFRSGVGGAGRIQSTSGNLPGLTTNIAAIPAGSGGVGVPVSAYQNSGVAPTYDAAQYAEYSSAYRRESVIGSMEYDFTGRTSAFWQSLWGRNETRSTGLPLGASLTIPAGAPGNPFGVPILLNKRFYDVAPDRNSTTTNQMHTLGLRGGLWGDWRYETTATLVRTDPRFTSGLGTAFSAARVAAAFANPATGPVLIYDSLTGSPNPPGTIEALLTDPTLGAETNESRVYDMKVDGPVWALPAGDMQIAVGGEYREELIDFPLAPAATTTARNRYSAGYFAEVKVPLVSERQSVPMMRRLEVTAAARRDQYSDFPSVTTPHFGLLYQPLELLVIRASYSEGYKTPTLSELYSPLSSFDVTFTPGSALDAERGNQEIAGFVTINNSGNPNLHAENTESYTLGAAIEIPFVPGLSLSWNYYDTKYTGQVGSLSITDRIVLFPTTVIRGPKLPGDPASWSGPVTGYFDVPVNIAMQHLAGYDLGAKYDRSLGGRMAGTNLTWVARATRTITNELRSTPDLPLSITSTSDALPMQIVSSVFLEHGSYGGALTYSYRAKNRSNVLPSTRFTDEIDRFDVQFSYGFGQLAGGSWWRSMLDGTQMSLTVINLFDTRPPMSSSGLPDNTLVDSRLRRYALNLTKSF